AFTHYSGVPLGVCRTALFLAAAPVLVGLRWREKRWWPRLGLLAAYTVASGLLLPWLPAPDKRVPAVGVVCLRLPRPARVVRPTSGAAGAGATSCAAPAAEGRAAAAGPRLRWGGSRRPRSRA